MGFPRGGGIQLDIYYFGNCLQNLEEYNNRISNIKTHYISDNESFCESIHLEGLKPGAPYWIMRGQKLKLSHERSDYEKAGIQLTDFYPGSIAIEDAARLMVSKNRELFRATDAELYACIPADLEKILVLNEWYPRDFYLNEDPILTEGQLRYVYEFNKELTGLGGQDFETFSATRRQHEQDGIADDLAMWKSNRPGSYETWQQIAKVIVTGDVSNYRPTLPPNTHWKYYPESGSM